VAPSSFYAVSNFNLMATDPPEAPPPDEGLRRMLKWVFVVLILTVLFAVLVVEFTLRWFA
jgi:hypothetical protein